MPKKIPEQEREAIVAIVSAHPDGVQVKAICDGLVFDLPPRMLQRRLALLVKQKRFIVEGHGRGSRYRWSSGDVVVSPPAVELTLKAYAPHVEIYVPISLEAGAIKQAVREPIQNRSPVGFNRAFLDKCRNGSYESS